MITKYHIARYVSIALFALLGVQGLWGSYHQWAECDSVGKIVQTASLFGYGLFGVTAAVLLTWKRSVNFPIQAIWGICVITAAGAAPVAWGGAPIFTGVFSALGGGVIAAGILWLVRLTRIAKEPVTQR